MCVTSMMYIEPKFIEIVLSLYKIAELLLYPTGIQLSFVLAAKNTL